MKKTVLLSVLFVLVAFGAQSQQTTDSTASTPRLSTKEAIHRLQKDIPVLMQAGDIPGMSVALIRHGKLVWSGAYGVTNADTKKPVTTKTVFQAASLSKPVFAYGVMKLVDEGKLNLDTPLNKYLGNNYDVVDDDRINLVTARRVLSHSAGFPNWREMDGTATLKIHFTPGEKFSYSGEGIVYLAKVVEKITGMPLEEFMQQYVLQPLGMASSSYVWQPAYDSLKVYGHDVLGNVTGRPQPNMGNTTVAAIKQGGNAAASLSTNAEDYAKFVMAVLNGTGIKKSTWQQMLTPQIKVNDKYPQIAWGLGWGLEVMDGGKYFWHWGDNGDAKAYITAFLPEKDAVIYFANSENGLSITKPILDDAIGGYHPALLHLGYDVYNSPGRMLLKAIIAKGAQQPLQDYRDQVAQKKIQPVDEGAMNTLGYVLVRMKKITDAVAVFAQNTTDHPDSWNAWDSLAEGYMDNGDKDNAIKYYEKSLELNPKNSNGEAQLKKLRQ